MAERYIPEHRRTQFKAKNTFKPEELRRRREEQQVEIRKAKREENLAKRRGIGTGSDRPGASLGAAPDSDDDTAPTESQVCVGFFTPYDASSVISCAPRHHGYEIPISLLPRPPSFLSPSLCCSSAPLVLFCCGGLFFFSSFSIASCPIRLTGKRRETTHHPP